MPSPRTHLPRFSVYLLACFPILTSQDPFHKAPTQYSARLVPEQFSRTSVEAPPDAIPDHGEGRSPSAHSSRFRSYSATPQSPKPTFYRGSVEFSPADISATARHNQPADEEPLTYYGAAAGAPRTLPHPLLTTRYSLGQANGLVLAYC